MLIVLNGYHCKLSGHVYQESAVYLSHIGVIVIIFDRCTVSSDCDLRQFNLKESTNFTAINTKIRADHCITLIFDPPKRNGTCRHDRLFDVMDLS